MFECHITCNLADAATGEVVANRMHWSTSQIERDPVLGKASYFYLTTHSKGYQELWERLRATVQMLEFHGVTVVREKIELIVHDTRVKL